MRGGNLLIIEPPGPLAIPEAAHDGEFPVAPDLLAYAELRYRGTGSGDSKRPNCSCREFLTMPRIEPGLVPVVTDLERGLRELGIPFGIVGALVPELLLEARPAQMTNDADVTVVVQSLADFETLKDRLAGVRLHSHTLAAPNATHVWRSRGSSSVQRLDRT